MDAGVRWTGGQLRATDVLKKVTETTGIEGLEFDISVTPFSYQEVLFFRNASLIEKNLVELEEAMSRHFGVKVEWVIRRNEDSPFILLSEHYSRISRMLARVSKRVRPLDTCN